MTLLKTSLLSFIATAIKMLAGLVINKAIAVYIGPAGLALIGQFQNFMQLALTVGQGAINGGVTKYVAEYGREDKRLPVLFSTAAKISLTCSILTGLVIAYLSKYISFQFFDTDDYSYVLILFGMTVTLFVINNLLLSILNGLKDIKTWAAINIIQSLYSLIFTTLLIVYLSFDGALIALVTNQSVVFLVVLIVLRRDKTIVLGSFRRDFSMPLAKKLGKFSLMTFTSAISLPVSHMIVRNYIGEEISLKDAGYWQAVWYISSMYLTIVITTLGVYYLPRLSEIKSKKELGRELINGIKIIVPIVVLMAMVIYSAKDLIIILLFSEEFIPMRNLFLWQLCGDVVKVAAWLFASLMLAKAMARAYIATEILFSISFVFLSICLLSHFGLVGVTYAYAINYVLYFMTSVLITRKIWY